MNVLLKKIDCDNDIEIFGKYKVELTNFHQQHAQKLGLFDNVVDNYRYDDAIRHIDDNFRGKGIVKEVMRLLETLNYRIELECWYEMPANNLYKSLGKREIKARYMMD